MTPDFLMIILFAKECLDRTLCLKRNVFYVFSCDLILTPDLHKDYSNMCNNYYDEYMHNTKTTRIKEPIRNRPEKCY